MFQLELCYQNSMSFIAVGEVMELVYAKFLDRVLVMQLIKVGGCGALVCRVRGLHLWFYFF